MGKYKNLIFKDFCTDAWTELKNSKLPILIYGMGNGAEKIIHYFEEYGIEYQDFFASDGFVRGHSFKGKTVLSYSQARDKYPQGFDIVVSFGSKLPDVIEKIYSLEDNHNIYALDVPVCGNQLFNKEFFDIHEQELYDVRELFCDDKSKEVFDDIVRFKLSGKLKYLKTTAFDESELDALLQVNKYKIYADLGAYNGDTIKKYLSLCPNLKKIYAFEPDTRNFKKLSAFCDNISYVEFILLNNPACDSDRDIEFLISGNRNSSGAGGGSFEHKKIILQGKALDLVANEVDFIKYDVEGLEFDALLGSKELIAKCSPDLLVSMYHKSEDMYLLPQLVSKLNPSYKLYLRRLPYIPAWDLNLYAINENIGQWCPIFLYYAYVKWIKDFCLNCWVNFK